MKNPEEEVGMFGFYRVAIAVPKLKIGDIAHNLDAIFAMAKRAEERKAVVALFPELSITSYSCADLFHNSVLLENSAIAINRLAELTAKMKCVLVLGSPLRWRKGIYNCAIAIKDGRILAVIPKSYIPNYKEFYEKRWFQSGKDIRNEEIRVADTKVPFGTDIILSDGKELNIAVEICEDLWAPIAPSSHHAIAGANLILNLSASNELIGKSEYRRDLVKHHSARCICAYAFCSAGTYESSTDTVFGGHCMLSENGAILIENERFESNGFFASADIDCQKLNYLRFSESSFNDSKTNTYRRIELKNLPKLDNIERDFDPRPFVPADKTTRDKRCEEIFKIQGNALAKRLEHAKAKKAIIGISGGLDSTLALLATEKAFQIAGKKNSDIISITMPGFGTSSRTLNNAIAIAKIMKTEIKTIDISKACKRHLRDIGKSEKIHDITFENAQARERTQILMDIANAEGGIVVGTADLSEIALGWSTFNGDHMSMYSINSGIPKTLVRHIIEWVAHKSSLSEKRILLDILDTPISPELLPRGKNGKIIQETEKILGAYELHDFFLYHSIKYGASPAKIDYIAKIAFKSIFSDAEIKKTLNIFISRFIGNQFKRNCCPDGPKVGSIALSPRADWRMPSDMDAKLWLNN